MKTVLPSSSYFLLLPNEIAQSADGRVSSFWIEGEPLLLQLSSYLRDGQEQVGAMQRLKDRIAKSSARWTIWDENIHPSQHVEQAVGETSDKDGVTWVHAYLVWPHLTVHATISGPRESVRADDSWASEALRSLGLNLQ